MRRLTGLNGGEWVRWSKWADTGFIVVAKLNEEGRSDGIFIVAKPHNDRYWDSDDDSTDTDGHDHHADGGCGGGENARILASGSIDAGADNEVDDDRTHHPSSDVETENEAAMGADNTGAAMPQYKDGKQTFAWGRIGDRLGDMGYETELVLKDEDIMTSAMDLCWAGVEKGGSVARPVAS